VYLYWVSLLGNGCTSVLFCPSWLYSESSTVQCTGSRAVQSISPYSCSIPSHWYSYCTEDPTVTLLYNCFYHLLFYGLPFDSFHILNGMSLLLYGEHVCRYWLLCACLLIKIDNQTQINSLFPVLAALRHICIPVGSPFSLFHYKVISFSIKL